MKMESKATVQLNSDIVSEVLSRLRVKHLLRFKSVCKSWLRLISSEEFVTLHRKNSSFRAIPLEHSSYFVACPRLFPPPNVCRRSALPQNNSNNMVLVGSSCDGLVCLYNHEHGIIHIWNPSITSSACIPIKKPDDEYVNCFWFGKHNEEYKILLGTTWSLHLIRPYVDHYKYKSTQEFRNYYRFHDKIGTLLNGNVHWAVRTRGAALPVRTSILSYDLRHETVGEIPIPTPLQGFVADIRLGEINGWLSCITKRLSEDGVSYVRELWVMKEYGVKESWIKLVIPSSHPILCIDKFQELEMDDRVKIKSPFYTKQVYVESLVSPREGAGCHSRFCCCG